MSTKFDVKLVTGHLDKVTNEAGVFEIIECGFDILPKEYHEFWSWLFDDKVFNESEELGRIACYAPTKELEDNKRALYAYVKTHPIAYDLSELKINHELPARSYDECRAELYFQEERKAEEHLKQLLCCYTDRLQKEILEDMKCYSDAKTFSLSACVEAERELQAIIEECWQDETQGRLEEYMAQSFDINRKVRRLSGCGHYLLPKNISVKKSEDGLLMTIQPYLVDYIDMQHVYDVGWRYTIEATAFILYKYALEENGTVYIAIEGRRPLPEYEFDTKKNQGEYFLFLYRCMKLKNGYRWIELYDILKDRVNQFEQEVYYIAKSENGFIRQGKKLARNYAVHKGYRNMILDKLVSGDRLRNLLVDVYGDKAKEIEIHRDFSMNLFYGKCTSKNRCYSEEPLDMWCSNSDVFIGIILDWDYPNSICKIFFMANYLSDIRNGLVLDVSGRVDSIRLEKHTKVMLLVLKQKTQFNSILTDWLKLSENVIDKVEIIYRDIV